VRDALAERLCGRKVERLDPFPDGGDLACVLGLAQLGPKLHVVAQIDMCVPLEQLSG
jgi:hypothetical protein